MLGNKDILNRNGFRPKASRSRLGRLAGLLYLLLVVQPVLLAGEVAPAVFGKITHRGLIDCFTAELATATEPVYCEASAVVFADSRIIIASDKPIPGRTRSSVFAFEYAGSEPLQGAPTYLSAKPFLRAIKYEDMTLTSDAAYVIATTGFDRVKADSADWDGYNTMLLWPVGKPDAVKLIAGTQHAGINSSVGLRKQISRLLPMADYPLGAPYFKVEGIAVIPGQKLLLGIREAGADYRNFSYTARIIAAPYSIKDGQLELGDFELIYDFDPSAEALIPEDTGLSSIEYDQYHDRLYLLTSFELDESDEAMGGYLWVLPMDDLRAGKPPSLVMKDSNHPLLFAHKPEGVAVLGDNRVMVVHDDDRTLGREIVTNPSTQFSKGAHQAAYTLVELGASIPAGLPQK